MERELCWGLRIEFDLEFEHIAIESQYLTAAQIAADPADTQCVPGADLENLVRMPAPSPRETDAHRLTIEFFFFDEQTVHDRSPTIHPRGPLLECFA